MTKALPQQLSCVDLVVTITNGAGRGKLRRHVSGRGDERGHERLVEEGVSVGRVAHGAGAQPLLRRTRLEKIESSQLTVSGGPMPPSEEKMIERKAPP